MANNEENKAQNLGELFSYWYSHVDLVDLVLQLFVRGKVFEKLLFLVFAVSISVLVVAAHVAA